MIKKFGSFLNEAFPGEFDFKTEIHGKDVDFSNLEVEDGYEVTDKHSFFVEWVMDFESRDRGIKSLDVIIKKVFGSYEIRDEAQEEKPHDVEFLSDGWEMTATLNCENFKFGSSVMPVSIELDFSTKKLEVTF